MSCYDALVSLALLSLYVDVFVYVFIVFFLYLDHKIFVLAPFYSRLFYFLNFSVHFFPIRIPFSFSLFLLLLLFLVDALPR